MVELLLGGVLTRTRRQLTKHGRESGWTAGRPASRRLPPRSSSCSGSGKYRSIRTAQSAHALETHSDEHAARDRQTKSATHRQGHDRSRSVMRSVVKCDRITELACDRPWQAFVATKWPSHLRRLQIKRRRRTRCVVWLCGASPVSWLLTDAVASSKRLGAASVKRERSEHHSSSAARQLERYYIAAAEYVALAAIGRLSGARKRLLSVAACPPSTFTRFKDILSPWSNESTHTRVTSDLNTL